ncbi:hypothetical protein GA0111570_104166 [Raineyella antarctica]|uniref:Uncharacterized protein n=2 Tax=Raineyella antarctica TaxID=1577474 RepID=A0A1G6GNN4_9ACTN|nr:hypothetical protein GA0111570_104166 [Raineyella antarctica]
MRVPLPPVPVLARPRVGAGLIGAATVLALWAYWLGLVLPVDLFAQDWSVAWTGLANWQLTWVGIDALEVLGLALTGVALRRGHWAAPLIALGTLPIFVMDAWFDIMTTVTLQELLREVALAVFVELPTAGILAWVAWSGIRRMRSLIQAALEFENRPSRGLGPDRRFAVPMHPARSLDCGEIVTRPAPPSSPWVVAGL